MGRTFTFERNPFEMFVGDSLVRSGYDERAARPTIWAIDQITGTVVVHRKGFSYNPGSPHSGLINYQPAEMSVYHYNGTNDRFDRPIFEEMISFAPRKFK